MREKSSMTHNEMIAKWMEDPEFKKAVSELKDQYAVLDEKLAARKVNLASSVVLRSENPKAEKRRP